MNRRLIAVAVALFVSTLSTPVWAQDGAEGEDAAPETTESAEDAPADDAESVEGSEAEEDAADTGDEAADDEAADDEEAEAAAEGADTAEGEEVLGPGGKPLRTDYPGTEESLKARMETNQLEGFNVDPDKPAAAYTLKIKELESKVDDLKERVFQSKTRIVLLKETLLSGNLAGAQSVIIHRTEAGPAFKLRHALYSLDGNRVFSQVDKDDDLADKSTFEVYNGSVSPGNHNLSVYLKYQGSGYGLFPYFEGYSFEIRSSCQFDGKEGKVTQVKVVTFQDGDATTSMEDRLNTRCEIQYFDNVKKEGEAGVAEAEGSEEASESE